MAADTLVETRNIAFGYNFATTAGTLTLLSAGNQDGSQPLTSATGAALASAGVKGSSPDRVFEFLFQADNLGPADKFLFDLTRLTNNAGGAINFLLDDVELTLVETTNPPVLVAAAPVYSMQHARITFSEPIDSESATNAANYVIVGLPVINAWLLDSRRVEIQTADQTPGAGYTVQVSNVKGQNGVTMTAGSVAFTAPNMAYSAVKYDAGTTVTMPLGAPDPVSPEGNDWTVNVNTQAGMSKEGVLGDLGGLNAWKVSDNNSLSSGGSIVYNTPVDPASDLLARANGWRLVMRARYVSNFAKTAPDQLMLYGDPAMGVRSGIFLGIDGNGLFATLLGGGGTASGNTYHLTDLDAATNAYHTHVLAFDPSTALLSYYFDGRLVVADFAPQVIANINGVQFGSASSTGLGEVNYNRVGLDVVGAPAPVVVKAPQTSTNGVGQKVTFAATVTPWVNSFQWYSNDVVLAGATSTNYTTGFITPDNSGDEYKLKIYSGFGNRETAARVWVTDDTVPPTIVSVRVQPDLSRVRVLFSEPMQELYATDPANYVWISPGLTTLSATMIDMFTVELQVDGLAAGMPYTVQVSNVRDTSNLVIANNSPASFTAPVLQVLARYYAGTPQDHPAGPPDPMSPAGGGWLHTYMADPGIATNAIVDDGGWNAWQIVDGVTADNGKFNNYHFPLSPAEHQTARQFGWVMTVRVKLLDANTTGNSAIFAQYEDDQFFRNILNFTFDTSADLRIGLAETNGFSFDVVTAGGVGFFDYHLHQVVYDPVSKTASYYFDGQLIRANWSPTYVGPNSVAEPFWGAAASKQFGTANFNLFELAVVAGPTVNVGVSNGNIQVAYRGVLQAAPNLTSGTWTPVATNATSAPVNYTVPAGSPDQQFFRAVAQ